MHSQNSSFKIWRDANILLHNVLENTQTESQEDYIKKGNVSFLLISAEGNLNSSLRK